MASSKQGNRKKGSRNSPPVRSTNVLKPSRRQRAAEQDYDTEDLRRIDKES